MGRWPHQVNWRTGPFLAKNPHRDSVIQLDTDFLVREFTVDSFTLSVGAVWDWDLEVDHVGVSRWAAVQAARFYQAEARRVGGEGKWYSLERLAQRGWELFTVWVRRGGKPTSGPAVPHPGLRVPVRVVFDPEVEKAGLAWLVRANQPTEYPAYQRVLWAEGAEITEPDPDLDRLDAALREVQEAVAWA